MIVSTTIGGLPVELFLIEPDWAAGIQLELGIAVDSETGDTGKETRQPESLHPRFKMSFTPDWKNTDSEAIITMLATIGAKRVAMPIFPDTQTDISDSFILEGVHYVSWDGNGSYAVDANTYDKVAPLAFGYLVNSQYQAITDTIGKAALTFIEDCDYAHRLKVVNGATTDDFTLSPDSMKVVEDLVSPLERKELGQGREALVENRESVFRYEMTAEFLAMDQTEISYLLSFWYQKKGRLHTFTVPAWFQPATATAATPDAYRARFKGEKIRLHFTTPNLATTQLGFVQVPWELNSSGVEHVTDWLFEDSSQWTGLDANVTRIATPAGIYGMPDRVVRIAPDGTSADRGPETEKIPAVEGDKLVISALFADSASISAGKEGRIGFKVYNSVGTLIADGLMDAPGAHSTTARLVTYEYTLPANAASVRAKFVSPWFATPPGDAYTYVGDPSAVLYKAAAITLSETPIQAPRCYAFEFVYEVPGKSTQRLLDWERSVTIGGNSFAPYKMTVASLSLGTRMFSEETTLAYSHEDDNPLLEFVLGGLERLVTLNLYEGNPNRPESFSTVFVGKLKSLTGKGRSLSATFTAFGGIFDKKLPGFVVQSKCNYTLGDANCGVNLASLAASDTGITSAALTESGYKVTLGTMSGTLTTINDPDSNPGDRFSGGYLQVGSGDNYQIRFVRKTTDNGATSRTFTLNRPLDATKLDASDGVVTVYPGCGGAAWECSGFWSNYVNFGGHPFVPEKLDTVQGDAPKVGK